MQTKIQREGETVTVFLQGELDHHTAPYVRNSIDDALECAHPKALIMDFSEVSFMDSSGIGLVMGRYKLLKEWEGTLTLCGLSGHVYKVMRLAGMEQLATLSKKGIKKEEKDETAE